MSHLAIAEYPIFEHKNGYFSDFTDSIFLPSDFIVEERPYTSPNKIFWGEENIDRKGKFYFKGFRQTARVCRERLEIYGASLAMAKKDFQMAIKSESNLYGFKMKGTSFEKYIETIWHVISHKIIYSSYTSSPTTDLAHHLASNDFFVDGQSSLGHNYSLLYALPDDTILEYDLTDIIAGGWVQEEEVKNVQFEKIIILTEGRTDVEFISSALLRLYPYLEPYYHFINFDEYRVESNASALVKLVTSLAAAKIKHPIIVLFDNDTTGIMEMKKLTSMHMGDNFRILKYPDLPIANKYPTIGPTGIKKININGLACGIELYLGQDTLMEKGSLTPVQWKGYNERENKYQGEIHNKSVIQDRFRKKVKDAAGSDFEDITLILKLIFSAFSRN